LPLPGGGHGANREVANDDGMDDLVVIASRLPMRFTMTSDGPAD